jgi:hypothetical protein
MNRPEILDTAKSYVCQDRQASYDTPENNFTRIAQMWSAYKGVPFQPHDVAAMMALLKIARIASSPGKDDNWVDLAGYAACGGEVASLDPERTIGLDWKIGEAPLDQTPAVKMVFNPKFGRAE